MKVQKRFIPSFDCLERRDVPARLPVQGGVMLGTYAQFQDVDRLFAPVFGRFNNNIHFHEGVDIAVGPGTETVSILRGRIEAVHTDPLVPRDSFVVIRDVDANDNPLATGFNYKHVIPGGNLRVGDPVAEGAPIGTVADFGGGLPHHVHVDRGENPVNNAPNPVDPTLAIYTNPLPQEVNRRREVRDRAEQTLRRTLPGTRARALADDAYQDAVKKYTRAESLERSLRKQFPTLKNPMDVLGPLVADNQAPTVSAIHFRLAADDQLGQLRVLNGDLRALFNQPAEVVRQTARYFGTNSPDLIRLGKVGSGFASSANTTSPTPVQRANIDVVANIFDRVTNGNNPLNPTRFDLTVTSASFNVTTDRRPSFDFSGMPTYTGVGDFWNLQRVRVVYENDGTHNSRITGPFHYNITNSPNLSAPQVQVGGFDAAHRGLYWNSDAAVGSQLFTSSDANDATSNATSAFPDDFYTVTVGATDFAGLRGTLERRVLLTNWTRTITVPDGVSISGGTLEISGGAQYRANQQVSTYLLRRDVAPDNLQLPVAAFLGAVSSDSDGNILPNENVAPTTVGNYVLIADYNGDGQFTRGLDAVTSVRVRNVSTTTLTSAPANSQTGRNVVLTATIAGDPTNRIGEVAFYNGSVRLGTASTVNGVATFSVSTLPVGNHNLRAVFNGSSVLAPSEGSVQHTVTAPALPRRTSQLQVTPSQQAVGYGGSVGIDVVVTGEEGPPSGDVALFDGDRYLGLVSLDNGQGSLNVALYQPGTTTLRAIYGGDGDFEPDTDESAIDVGRISVNLTPSAGSYVSTIGDVIEVTCGINTGSSEYPLPEGSIQLFDGDVLLGESPIEDGAARISALITSAGSRTLTLRYVGNQIFNFAEASLSLSASRLESTVAAWTFTGESNDLSFHSDETEIDLRSVFGEPLVVRGVVGNDFDLLPTGLVSLYIDGEIIAEVTASQFETGVTLPSLSVGSHQIGVTYQGDVFQSPSALTFTHIVDFSDSITEVSVELTQTSSTSSALVTAVVTSGDGSNSSPTGKVLFYDNGTYFGTGDLVDGVATIALDDLNSGCHNIFAIYQGDAGHLESLDARTVVLIDEGTSIVDMGDFGDVDHDALAIIPSIGSRQIQPDGTWHWELSDMDADHEATVSRIRSDGTELSIPVQIKVRNLPPTATISGPSGIELVGQATRLVFFATDATTADQNAGFAYTVNWGDGASEIISATAGNGSGVLRSHNFVAGTYVVSITAQDKDGAISTPAMWTVSVVDPAFTIGCWPAPVYDRSEFTVVSGTTGSDTLSSSASGRLWMEGGWGADTIRGGGSADLIFADKGIVGNAASSGDPDADELIGIRQQANNVGSGYETLIGMGGDDVIFGAAAADRIYGDGNESGSGISGDDVLFGFAGNDDLFGGAGNDFLVGGVGSDLLEGGDGIDTTAWCDLAFNGTGSHVAGIVLNLSSVSVEYRSGQRVNDSSIWVNGVRIADADPVAEVGAIGFGGNFVREVVAGTARHKSVNNWLDNVDTISSVERFQGTTQGNDVAVLDAFFSLLGTDDEGFTQFSNGVQAFAFKGFETIIILPGSTI